MRIKVVASVLLAAFALLGITAWLSKNSRPLPAVPQVEAGRPGVPDNAAANLTPNPAEPRTHDVPRRAGAPAIAAHAGTVNTPESREEHEEFVGKRSAELNDLAMEDSPDAHQQIVDEVKNPDREIRRAALAALEQASDRSVVPRLQQIAGETDDPADKKAILDAIDFINLPTLTEYLQQHQKR